MKKYNYIFYILSLFFCSFAFSQTFYFYLPWDDYSSNVTDLSWLNHKPAGKYGFISVGTDGHFYAGTERIKFLGVNFTASSCFPQKTQAEAIAKRLAKFGINIVRLHFLDNMWGLSVFGPAGSYTTTRSFYTDALDRLDYFISKLKENGIYVNINLLVGRNFLPGDGLPESINQLDWKQKQVPAMFYQPMIDLQKEYATNLLTRTNPYTSLAYKDDPAIAMVEIVNEHGLIQGWLDGTIDILPQEFSSDLQQKWNDWLVNKYQTHSNLVASGWALSEPLGNELLKNNDFLQGFTYWNPEQHDIAKASFTIVNEGYNGSKAVKITIQNTSATSWHIQFNQPNLVVFSSHVYTFTFYAKADRNTSIGVQLGQAHTPWSMLGLNTTINLTTYYQLFTFQVQPTQNDNNARVNFTDMCKELATYWFSDISFKQGGNIGLFEGENLDQKTIGIIKYSERNLRTQIARQDWVNFLYQLEENFWLSMYDHLKSSVGIRCPITGTTVGLTSEPNIMGKLDFIDTHSYWHHPVFPGSPWDMNNWYITNATLVRDTNGGTITEIAMRRVYGKPFTITEYNHPAPNTFSSEAYIFLSAYASFHDWDGIFGYTYLDGRTTFNLQRIEGFFDLNQHPTKFLTFIPAALIYRRGDIKASDGSWVVVDITKNDEINQALNTWAWRLIQADDKGMNRKTALVYKTAQITEEGTTPQNSLSPQQITLPSNNYYESDTSELKWDTANGIFIVDTEKTKCLVGYVANKEFNFGSLIIRPKDTLQNGWANITLSCINEGYKFNDLLNNHTTGQILITATGACGNPSMNWMIYPNTPTSFPPPVNQNITVDNQWGTSPSFVEGINCDFVLSVSTSRIRVYALNNKGERKTILPISSELGKAKFSISYTYQTLWYEIEISSSDQPLVVDNPPNVNIIYPQTGAILSSSVTITVNAYDDFGINKVEFYINDVLKLTDITTPYFYIWYTTSVPNGIYSIKVIAYDTLLQTTTTQVTVSVNNSYYTLKTTVNPPNSGSIIIYPNKTNYLKGESVQLYASANSGYKFLNWSGDVVGSSNPVVIIVDSTKTVVANFEVISSTQPPQEDQPPVININLINGQSVSGNYTIIITAQDNIAVSLIKLYINNNHIAQKSDSTTLEYLWNTYAFANGIYEIKIEAYDNLNQKSEKTVSVSINNIPNNQPPQIILQNLQTATTISSNYTIYIDAQDDDTISKIEVYIDDALVETLLTMPFKYSLNPSNYPEGKHIITFIAYDSYGQTNTVSAEINLIKTSVPISEKYNYLVTLNDDGVNDTVKFFFNKQIKELKIYTHRGKLVRELTENFEWDIKSSEGKVVKPGMYIYKAYCDDGTKIIGKILIIK